MIIVSVLPANKIASKLMSSAKKSKMNKQMEVLFKKPMSTSRKLAFVLSVLMCFLTVAVFLWVIPCDWSTCPSKTEDANTAAWSITATGIGNVIIFFVLTDLNHHLCCADKHSKFSWCIFLQELLPQIQGCKKICVFFLTLG